MSEPEYITGQNVILDLGPFGLDFYCKLEWLIGTCIIPGALVKDVVDMIYDGIMGDLVRAMGLQSYEALEMFKSFPHPDGLGNIIHLVNYDAPFEDLSLLIKEQVTFIYVNVLASQIDTSGRTLYIPRKIGQDYLAVTEAHRVQQHSH